MFGYNFRMAIVDLTTEKTKVEEISESFCKKFLGGNGFGIRLLYEHTKPKIDPLSPENVIVFAIGPFAGTPIPTSGKYIVQAKSPLTGFQGESISTGSWSHALKRAGYDALLIFGRAKKPTYLFVDDDIIELRDAKELWGKDCMETEDLIREGIGDDNVKTATIGPAGENLVLFAGIVNEGRIAGRTGMGTVMGTKNLKAVAVRGTKNVNVAKLEELMELSRDLIERCRTSPATHTYNMVGTPGYYITFDEFGAVPKYNFQRATMKGSKRSIGDIRDISAEYMTDHYANKPVGCVSCPIACDHRFFITEGPYKDTYVGVDYETIYALGAMCGISNFPAIAKANDVCDRMGIDTMSTGVTIAWAMECIEKGIFKTDDIDLTFGNEEALIEIIPKIAHREGLGDLLAEGVKRASEKIGKGSDHFAMHVKGLEFAGYDVRGMKATGLSFAVSTRGACHLRGRIYRAEVTGKIDRFKVEKSRGKFVADQENLCTIFDTMMLCKFSDGIYKDVYGELANLYTLVTGIPFTAEELKIAGERIYNMEKAYNVREGGARKDDSLPPRIFKDPITSGFAKGSHMTVKELDFLLDDYYTARGWNMDSIPTKQKLIELGLDDIAKEVGA